MQKRPNISLFQRFLYRSYHRGSALSHFFKHRIRPPAVAILFFFPVPWLLMAVHNGGSLWQLRCILFILPLVCLLWLLFRKAQVSITRETPRLATVAQEISYPTKIHNLGRRTIYGSQLLEICLDNRPSIEHFWYSEEPGEATRNLFDRTLAYYRWKWLQRKLNPFKSNVSDPLNPIAPGQELRTTLTLTPQKRGIISLRDTRLCLLDPLGLFQRCIRTESAEQKITVLPKRYRLGELETVGSAQLQLGGDSTSNAVGSSGDFTSTREYQPGDAKKSIHWKSWARTGKPIVKEYENLFFPRYGLVLDTDVKAQDCDLFEEAVSVAASYAVGIDTTDSIIDLMFIKDEAYSFSAGRGEEKTSKLLEILSTVECQASASMKDHFSSLEKLILRHRHELTCCIYITTNWCEERQNTIQRLHRADLNLKVIVICSDIDTAKLTHQQYPSPVPIQWLRQEHIQQDLLTSNTPAS